MSKEIDKLKTRRTKLTEQSKEIQNLTSYNEKALYNKYENKFLKNKKMIEEWIDISNNFNDYNLCYKIPEIFVDMLGNVHKRTSIDPNILFMYESERINGNIGAYYGCWTHICLDINECKNCETINWYIYDNSKHTKEPHIGNWVTKAMVLKYCLEYYDKFKEHAIEVITARLDAAEDKNKTDTQIANEILSR